MTDIEEAITEHWGKRCPDFDPNCHCCKAWAEYDRLRTIEIEHGCLVGSVKAATENYSVLKSETEKLRINLSFEEARADTVTASNMILLKKNAHLRVEIMRLRAALDTANANCDRMASLAIDNAKDTERLRAALERMLLEFDFMVESNIISDVRNDVIFVQARAALTQQGGER